MVPKVFEPLEILRVRIQSKLLQVIIGAPIRPQENLVLDAEYSKNLLTALMLKSDKRARLTQSPESQMAVVMPFRLVLKKVASLFLQIL